MLQSGENIGGSNDAKPVQRQMEYPQNRKGAHFSLKASTTENIFNFTLGEALRGKHPLWSEYIGVEQTQVIQGSPGKQIDILVSPPGSSPVVIETEFMPADTVEADAVSRLNEVLASDHRAIEHAIALRVPPHLRTVAQGGLSAAIESASFSYCVFSALGDGANERWPARGWLQGGINDAANCVEAVALSETLVSRSTDVLERGVAQAANLLATAPQETWQRIAGQLRQSPGEQTNRMAVAIVVNAIVFHTRIEGRQGVPLVSDLEASTGLTKRSVTRCWNWIIENVNYWPIFKIASDLLDNMPTLQANRVLNRLHETANELTQIGAAGLNDLSGRMFQKLIADRKFLATFYTLPVSAALLAELAASRLKIDWRDVKAVKALKIADLACGTGTLIGALYQAVLSRHRRTGSDDAGLHSAMIEESLYAFDIMPAATHLAASTLSNAHPGITFGTTRIVTMPYGNDGKIPRIGSLELIADEYTKSLFSLGREQLTGTADAEADSAIDVPHKSLDIVIMNPPFTRPTGQEAAKVGVPVPSFAGFGTSGEEQKAMAIQLRRNYAQLRKRRREERNRGAFSDQAEKDVFAGHGNAGLASNFMDLAHEKLAPGGVLALVLPFTFAQGDAWSGARRLLETSYRDITVVSIATAGSRERAFSADTGMAEILIVAVRRERADRRPAEPALFVNLNRRPATLLEGVIVAGRISALARRKGKAWVRASQDSDEVEFGTCAVAPLSMGGCAGVRSVSTLARAMMGLFGSGRIELPRRRKELALPVVPLREIGERGAHVLDITGTAPGRGKPPRGPFTKAPLREDTPPPAYPALWNHGAARERRLVVEPDGEGLVRDGCRDHAVTLWNSISSRLHINVDFRVNSQALAACLTPEKTIGGRAWPNFRLHESAWEIPFVLWANTTIGLMAFWWIGTRQQQGRTILPVSQHPLLPALDPRALMRGQLAGAEKILEEFRARAFLPANEAYRDEARQGLDRAVLVDLIGLPEDVMEPLALLRLQWCAEPSVHGGKSTRPQAE